jgi:glycopeptide antibiotics resistance protein
MEVIKVLTKILTNILTALYEPFGFSLLLSFLAMFFYLYSYEAADAGKGWKSAIMTWHRKFKESIFFRKLFLLAFVTSMILFRTLLNRNLWMNPLSKVMGGWSIWETVNGEQKLTTESIENVIMMIPFSSVAMWIFDEKTKVVWKSGRMAFCFSVGIEFLQLLLRLGTFQVSDIFYNTVGGCLGGLFYWLILKQKNGF